MNKYIIIVVAVLIISGGLVFTQTGLFSGSDSIQSYATGTYFNTLNEFAFSSFLPMTCQYINEMYVKYQGESTFSNVAFDSSPSYNPQIQFDLTNRNTGKLIDSLRIDFNQKCDISDPTYIPDKALRTSGFALVQLGTGDLGDDVGNEITSFESVPINVNITPGEWKVIASKTYTNMQQYEKDLILHNDVNAWIKAFGIIDVEYDFFFQDSRNDFNAGGTDGVGSLLTKSAWLVRADANVITPPEPNANTSNEPIFLESIHTTLSASQGGQDGEINDTNPLDTNKNSGRQLMIEGTVRKWLSTEGLPVVSITDATGRTVVSGTMLFAQKSGDDGEFVFYYSMEKNSPNGKYTVKMTHPNRFQGDFSTPQVSTKTFIVENSETVTTTSTTNDDGSTVTQTSTGTVTSFFGRIVLVWESLYTDGSVQRGIIGDDAGFSTNLSLSLANQVDGENKVLQSVKVTPVLQFEKDAVTKQFTIESSDIVFDTTIELGGETVALDTRNTILFSPQRALCIDDAITNTSTCANTGFSLGSVILGTDAITNKILTIDKAQSLPKGGTAKAKIIVDISGDFTARNDDNGKAYSGNTDGSQFIWETTYINGELGQTVTTETNEETGETQVVVTNDGTGSGDPNPEKPDPTEDPETETCTFDGDNYSFKSSNPDTCAMIQVFKDHVNSRGEDGQCYSTEFPDTNGILRTVTFCNEVDSSVTGGGASGTSGGGLSNDGDDKPKGSGGLGAFCEGTVIQCAEAFTQEFDNKIKSTIGLDSIELGIVLFVVIIVIAIIAGVVALRRKNNY